MKGILSSNLPPSEVRLQLNLLPWSPPTTTSLSSIRPDAREEERKAETSESTADIWQTTSQ